MQTKELLELVVQAGHVGEVTRLLSAFSQRRTVRLGKVELVELANQTAGATYRYPNPEPSLKVALTIGLVQKAGQVYSLTETGRLFLKLQGGRRSDLTFEQASLLFALFLDDPSMAEHIRALFRFFREDSSGHLEAKTIPAIWGDSVQMTAKVLQQLGVLEERAAKLSVNARFESVLPLILLEAIALTEQTLWARLDAQRVRAREAEELVLVEEQKRLVRLGRSDLAELVVRISAEDVSAGYDIGSFEEDNAPRFIEVKSSVGRAIQFEWSVREREVALEDGGRYWIYFVPLANVLQKRMMPILMLRDPIALIRSGKLTEVPSSYIVWATAPAGSFAGQKTVIRKAMQEWPS